MASILPLVRRGPPMFPGVTRISQLLPLHTTLKLPLPFHRSYLPVIAIPLLARSAFSNLRDTLSSIWESILLAVPKKRTSYSRKRSRQLAGKALKDVSSLNFCSSCGRPKRAHVLCTHCVMFVRDLWTNNTTADKDARAARKEAESEAGTKVTKLEDPAPKNPSWKEKFNSLFRG